MKLDIHEIEVNLELILHKQYLLEYLPHQFIVELLKVLEGKEKLEMHGC